MEQLTHPDDPDMMYIFCHDHIVEAKEMIKNKDMSRISVDTKKMNDDFKATINQNKNANKKSK